MIDFPHSHNPDPEWVSFVYGATATSHSKYSWFRHMLWVWDWPHSCLELDRICSSKRLYWESHACLGSSGAQLTVGGDSPGSQPSIHRPVGGTNLQLPWDRPTQVPDLMGFRSGWLFLIFLSCQQWIISSSTLFVFWVFLCCFGISEWWIAIM